MKKILSLSAALLSISAYSQAEEVTETVEVETAPVIITTPVVQNPNKPIEARTFFEVEAGLVSLNSQKASSQGYDSNGYSVSASAGIILGHFRVGAGAMGVLPADQDYNNLVDDEGYEVPNADIAFTGFNAFGGVRYLYLDHYEFNLDAGLTTMTNFQFGADQTQQEASLESSGGLFIRPSFNYYITSFLGVHASYFQMVGSDTTVKSVFSAGAVFKL